MLGLNKWTPAYLSALLTQPVTFSLSTRDSDIVPLWRDNQPLLNTAYLDFEPPSKKEKLTVGEFWERVDKYVPGSDALYLSSV